MEQISIKRRKKIFFLKWKGRKKEEKMEWKQEGTKEEGLKKG